MVWLSKLLQWHPLRQLSMEFRWLYLSSAGRGRSGPYSGHPRHFTNLTKTTAETLVRRALENDCAC